MPEVVWKLRRPNTPDTLFAKLGVTGCVRRLENAAVGTVEISFDRLKPTFAAQTMPYGTPVQVLRDGQPWFSGVVTGRSPIVSGAQEVSRITVSDPWRWLERTPFMQPGFFLLDPLAATTQEVVAPTVAGTVTPPVGLVTTVQDADPATPPRIIVNPTQILYGQSIGFVPATGPGQNIPGFSEFRPATSGTPALPTAVPGAVVTSKTDPATGTKTAAIVTSVPYLAPVAATPAAPTRTYATVVQESAHVAIGQDDAGRLISGAETIAGALDYCLSKFTTPPFQVGEIAPDIQVPAQEFNAQSCADVIRSVLQWAPDVTAWMDHATAPPTLHVARRSARPVVTLASGDDPDACVASASLEPLSERLICGVTLEYLRTYEQGGVTTPPYRQVDQAGFDPTGPGALVVSFSLSGSATTNDDGSATSIGEDAPAGLAQRVFEAYSTLEWRGTVELDEDDLGNRQAWPGVCVNVAGVEEAWETAAIQVQGSQENVFTGKTSLTMGPPGRLTPANFLALARAAQKTNRVDPTGTMIRTNGPGTVPPSLPLDPAAPINNPGGGGGGGGGSGGGGGGTDPNNETPTPGTRTDDPPADPPPGATDFPLTGLIGNLFTSSDSRTDAFELGTHAGGSSTPAPAYTSPDWDVYEPGGNQLGASWGSYTEVRGYTEDVCTGCPGSKTKGTIDLRTYSKLKTLKIELLGSRTTSKPKATTPAVPPSGGNPGTPATTPKGADHETHTVSKDISAFAGTLFAFLPEVLIGTPYVTLSGGGHATDGALTYTKLRVTRR